MGVGCRARDQDLEFRVWGYRVEALGFWIQQEGFRTQDLLVSQNRTPT